MDTRLLATLAALASQYAFQVTAFDDAALGAPVLFRAVTITGIARGRSAALAMVGAQNPLGLLSPVLETDSPRPAAAGGAISSEVGTIEMRGM